MPIESGGFNILNSLQVAIGVKAFLILFVIFYIVFAFILYRQVFVMNAKLVTLLCGVLKFIAIINVGTALAVLLLIIGLF